MYYCCTNLQGPRTKVTHDPPPLIQCPVVWSSIPPLQSATGRLVAIGFVIQGQEFHIASFYLLTYFVAIFPYNDLTDITS